MDTIIFLNIRFFKGDTCYFSCEFEHHSSWSPSTTMGERHRNSGIEYDLPKVTELINNKVLNRLMHCYCEGIFLFASFSVVAVIVIAVVLFKHLLKAELDTRVYTAGISQGERCVSLHFAGVYHEKTLRNGCCGGSTLQVDLSREGSSILQVCILRRILGP